MAASVSANLFKNSQRNGLLLVSRPCILISSKYSSDSKKTESLSRNPLFNPNNAAALKRGTGGRSSFNGIVATVFGASGFVGGTLVNKLGKIGTQIIVPYRGDHYDVLRLKLVGDLGQVLFFPYHLQDEDSIRKAMKYSNVVINLIGRDWETKNFKFDDVHVKGARTIARIARESGVKRFIHFSSLNSAEHPQGYILPEGSRFLSSKYHGELAVKEEFPEATIFRPADIWGQCDRFLFYYAHTWRRNFFHMPLWDKGEKTIKQPVYVSDVCQAVINALRDPDTIGKTYDALGPKRYLLADLVDYLFHIMRRDEKEWGYKRTNLKWDPISRAKITLTEKMCPSWPVAYLGWDKIERDHTTDEPIRGNPNLEELGVNLTALEERVDWELKMFRAYNYLEEYLGDYDAVAPPPTQPIIPYYHSRQ